MNLEYLSKLFGPWYSEWNFSRGYECELINEKFAGHQTAAKDCFLMKFKMSQT